MENETKSLHLAFLCTPGMGHIIPMSQLVTYLANVHDVTITLMINTKNHDSPAYLSILKSLPEKVNAITLPSPPPNSIPKDACEMTRMLLIVGSTLNHVHETLTSLQSKSRLDGLVVDMFTIPAKEMASKLGMPCYLFYSSTCMRVALAFHTPELVESYQGEFKALIEPVKLPGCVPVKGSDLHEQLHYPRNSELFHGNVQLCKGLLDMDGIFVNTYEELESGVVKALKNTPNRPKVYAIGPLTCLVESKSEQTHETLTWLDSQTEKSVVYVSFGSWGCLTPEQITELALGLELSNHKFIWVIKEGVNLLPEGFVERNKENGFVITSWGPQVTILKHKSVGSFITHCGWNSSLESITCGVPMIAYPLFAEQRMNAVLLSEDAKVCLRLHECEVTGLIERDEIARVVKRVMEGKEMEKVRERVGEMREAAMNAVREGGSSYKAMEEVVQAWKKDV